MSEALSTEARQLLLCEGALDGAPNLEYLGTTGGSVDKLFSAFAVRLSGEAAYATRELIRMSRTVL